MSQPAQIQRNTGVKLAVVLHLFYPEMWPVFSKRLDFITQPYDLIITVPKHKYKTVASQLAGRSNTTILKFNNRGRDILPFMRVAKRLPALGYKHILKLHSKKSTHRKDGSEWSNNFITNLLPDKEAVNKILEVLEQEGSGVVGPGGEYLQLTVNFDANGMHMTRIINRLYSKEIGYEVLQKNRRNYGFFAGSMFWANLEALKPLLDSRFSKSKYYEKERGQIDGTFAHAIERVFSLVCEIEGSNMYEINGREVKKIAYKTDNIPNWSNVYIGPKKTSH